MMKTLARFAPVLICVALSACSDLSTQVVCPDRASPALFVNVLDPVTFTSIAPQATGRWSTGAMSDSLVHVTNPASGEVMLAAFGPPGLYTVRVSRPGYPDWVRGDILVEEGVCGPRGAELTVQHAAGQ